MKNQLAHLFSPLRCVIKAHSNKFENQFWAQAPLSTQSWLSSFGHNMIPTHICNCRGKYLKFISSTSKYCGYPSTSKYMLNILCLTYPKRTCTIIYTCNLENYKHLQVIYPQNTKHSWDSGMRNWKVSVC